MEEEQVAQELPPPIGVDTPPASLAKDAKAEINLLASRLHTGHKATSST
ncbi:hypothetical protein M1O12_00880 [Dehalococcoidia bacterium]|nr:hypothetical protein [Dehalococcoidia bacterium]